MALTLIVLIGGVSAGNWPGESARDASNNPSQVLSNLDPDLRWEMSGAHWNDVTETLWVTAGGNSGKGTWALKYNAETDAFEVAARWDSPRGEDLTQITLIPSSSSSSSQVHVHELFVLDEDNSQIIQAAMSMPEDEGESALGDSQVIRSWYVAELAPTGTRGAEGMAFIPDEHLMRSNFTDGQGRAWAGSQGGFGGLMLIAHQVEGYVYALDLSAGSNDYTIVGGYATAYSESSALSFDRSVGILYISHDVDSDDTHIELTDLASEPFQDTEHRLVTRRFNRLTTFDSPSGLGNPEGFATTPYLVHNATGHLMRNPRTWAFFANDAEHKDSNTQQRRSVMWFKQFNPTLSGGDSSALPSSIFWWVLAFTVVFVVALGVAALVDYRRHKAASAAQHNGLNLELEMQELVDGQD
ncbi:MAG: hypothetical protein Q8P67_24410 [archaeon]|nr:hypothetical protein [archaeon]